MERAMKLQDVILKAMAKKISWLEAAEIAGVTDRTMRRIPAERTPPGAPETLTGTASQEEFRRLLRSQPRRLGFGQLHQMRLRLSCANITTRVFQ